MMVRACSQSHSGSWGTRIAWAREAEIAVIEIAPPLSSLGYTVRLSLKQTNKKPDENKRAMRICVHEKKKSYLIQKHLVELKSNLLLPPRDSTTAVAYGEHIPRSL